MALAVAWQSTETARAGVGRATGGRAAAGGWEDGRATTTIEDAAAAADDDEDDDAEVKNSALEYRTGPMKSGGQLATSLLLSEGGYFDLG